MILEENKEIATIAEVPLELDSGIVNHDIIMEKILKKTQGDDSDVAPITEAELN